MAVVTEREKSDLLRRQLGIQVESKADDGPYLATREECHVLRTRALRLSMRQFATYLGVTLWRVHTWEKGMSGVRISDLEVREKFLHALDAARKLDLIGPLRFKHPQPAYSYVCSGCGKPPHRKSIHENVTVVDGREVIVIVHGDNDCGVVQYQPRGAPGAMLTRRPTTEEDTCRSSSLHS